MTAKLSLNFIERTSTRLDVNKRRRVRVEAPLRTTRTQRCVTGHTQRCVIARTQRRLFTFQGMEVRSI